MDNEKVVVQIKKINGFLDKYKRKFLNEDDNVIKSGLFDKNGREFKIGDKYKVGDDDVYEVFFINGAFCGGLNERESLPLGWEWDNEREELLPSSQWMEEKVVIID